VQREEFKRLGVTGDWDHPYLTMAYPAEAAIASLLRPAARYCSSIFHSIGRPWQSQPGT
jgi:hypothetical protein